MKGPDEDLDPIERLVLVAAAAIAVMVALSLVGMVLWALLLIVRWAALGQAPRGMTD